MVMSRWDPFTEMTSLRQAVDQLFENSFIRPSTAPSSTTGSTSFSFPVDLLEQGDVLVVKASLPGVKPEDVNVSLDRNVLAITAEHRDERTGNEGRYYLAERRIGRFSRAIALPVAVEADACEARYDNGILTLTLPKAAQARTKQIPIRSQREPAEAQLGASHAGNGSEAEAVTAARN